MLTFDQIVDKNAKVYPTKIAVSDEIRHLSYNALSKNGSSLTNYFYFLGARKKSRVAFLAYNCTEFAEVLYATAKLGAIILPINFRLSCQEIEEIINDSKPKLIIYQRYFEKNISYIKNKIKFNKLNYLRIENKKSRDCPYKTALNYSKKFKFKSKTMLSDSWSLMYTSGTTGRPKGVVRSHEGYYHLSKTTVIEIQIKKNDNALLVMPLCHANSFNFFCAYISVGAEITIYSRKSFDAAYFFKLIKFNECTFTSLVPTHFIIILDYLKKNKIRNMLKKHFTFMISSAPAREDTKKGILQFFSRARLYELYGSSESGWVTMLQPDQQFNNIGTVGKECIGTSRIKILDKNFKEVKDGEIGELFAKTPYNFSHYWNNELKTKEAFFEDYVTVGDLAKRNNNGYIELVDRKKNMIISGGENIYPAEVENIIGNNPLIKDLAIIGVSDEKWGEIVCCFAILEDGARLIEEQLISWAKKRIAHYKCPKKVFFIKENDMPRNATGKILHKVLRERVKKLI